MTSLNLQREHYDDVVEANAVILALRQEIDALRTTTTTDGHTSDDGPSALHLRLDALQRQSDRQKARAARVEAELRDEVEQLRQALRRGESSHPVSSAAPTTTSSNDTPPPLRMAIVVTSPSPVTATQDEMPLPLHSSPSPAMADLPQFDEVSGSSHGDEASDVATHEQERPQEVATHHVDPSTTASAASAPITPPQPSPPQRPVVLLNPPLRSHAREPPSALSRGAGANDVCQRAAERRAMRMQRLQDASIATNSRPSSPIGGMSSLTSYAAATAQPLASRKRSNLHALHARTTSVDLQTVAQVPVNPNQIGIDITTGERHRQWYVGKALSLALLQTVSARDASMAALESNGGDEAKVLLYQGIPAASLQRAIEEVSYVYLRCAHNAPFICRVSKQVKIDDPPDFEEENTDRDLLAAFCPEATPVDPNTPHITRGGVREDELRITFHAPVVFTHLRRFLQLDLNHFKLALEHSPWRQSSSPGKSGTTLYFFGDYVMKSLRESEFDFLINRFIPEYVQYCERNHNTLLPRFYSLFSMKWRRTGETQRFVLMQNVFSTKHYIKRIYDVKGSSIGRSAMVPGTPPPRTAFGALLLKDNDLPQRLILCGSYQKAILLAQLRSDVRMLEQLFIVDYSCMIGVRSRVFSSHVETGATPPATPPPPPATTSTLADEETTLAGIVENNATTGQEYEDCYRCLHGCDGGLLSLPVHDPHDRTTAREDVYYVGIIDVLQTYTTAKRIESLAKGVVNDRTKISVVPPRDYAERLYKAIERISE